jgi:hypothetical protein
VPSGPTSIRDVETTKVKFERKSLPVSDGIKNLFPTLLAKGEDGMQYVEIKVD